MFKICTNVGGPGVSVARVETAAARDAVLATLTGEYLVVGAEVKTDGKWLYGGVLFDIPPKPTDFHKFNFNTGQWDETRTLKDFKNAKWDAMKHARQVDLMAPLATANGIFDAHEEAQANLMKSIILANNLTAMGVPVSIDYTLADNTVVNLDAAKMVMVGLTLAAREQAVRAKATTLRNQIEAATTVPEVAAIVW